MSLRVEFIWHGDRYSHVISVVTESGEQTPLLESIDGAEIDDWPPSPPLQTLRMEELPDGRRVALLIGMAGRSHWSASVETVLGNAELVFDIACKHPAGTRRLGSRYRQLSEAAKALLLREDAARFTESEGCLSIEPTDLAAQPATARWKYSICVKSQEAHH